MRCVDRKKCVLKSDRCTVVLLLKIQIILKFIPWNSLSLVCKILISWYDSAARSAIFSTSQPVKTLLESKVYSDTPLFQDGTVFQGCFLSMHYLVWKEYGKLAKKDLFSQILIYFPCLTDRHPYMESRKTKQLSFILQIFQSSVCRFQPMSTIISKFFAK